MNEHDVGWAIRQAEVWLEQSEDMSSSLRAIQRDAHIQTAQAHALIAIAKGIDELVDSLKPVVPKSMISTVSVIKGRGVK